MSERLCVQYRRHASPAAPCDPYRPSPIVLSASGKVLTTSPSGWSKNDCASDATTGRAVDSAAAENKADEKVPAEHMWVLSSGQGGCACWRVETYDTACVVAAAGVVVVADDGVGCSDPVLSAMAHCCHKVMLLLLSLPWLYVLRHDCCCYR